MPPRSARRQSGRKSPAVFSEIATEGLSTSQISAPRPRGIYDSGDEGDGGQVKSRYAEAALEKRGNAKARRDLEDQNRIYDSVDQRHWEQKYKFFSGRHMERTYRLFTRARHDPFNKDPSWGKSIIKRVSEICQSRKMGPEALFTGLDITGDGNLNRPEMKRVVCSVMPALSDEELTAIFDTMDKDKSGEINVGEFCETIRNGRTVQVSDEASHRWRNPVHRVKRMTPAVVEGWDHLEGDLKFKQGQKLCDSMQAEMQGRLSETLKSARGPTSSVANRPKHEFFNGGGETGRFLRRQFDKDKVENPERLTPRIKDPGAFPKPGWMYNTEMRVRTDKQGAHFDMPRPLTAR